MATNLDIIFGPVSYGPEASYTFYSAGYGYPLNDLNDAMACQFQFPKSGTVEDIGFFITTKVGTPPTYKVGLTTVNISGHPQQIAYGGSSIDDFSYTTSGWIWHTLGTPATVVAGEVGAVHIFPTTPVPDSSNYIEIQDDEHIYYVNPNNMQFTTSWVYGIGPNSMAIRYDDGDVVGLAIVNSSYYDLITDTSPDEVGDKFTVPINMTCIGAKVWLYAGSGREYFTVHLYNNSDTELRSVSGSTGAFGQDYSMMDIYWDTPINLIADTPYRLTLEQTGGYDPLIVWWQFESVASKSTLTIPQSDRWHRTHRTDGGAWTDFEDGLVWMGLIISAVEIGGTTGGDGEGTNRFGYSG